MTEKRFNSYCDNDNIRIRIDDENKEIFHIYFAELEDALYCKSKLNSLLEVLNAQHDALIKKDELLSKVLKVNDNYEKCLKQINEVLAKHNIHTLEKLDQVLTNERTW